MNENDPSLSYFSSVILIYYSHVYRTHPSLSLYFKNRYKDAWVLQIGGPKTVLKLHISSKNKNWLKKTHTKKPGLKKTKTTHSRRPPELYFRVPMNSSMREAAATGRPAEVCTEEVTRGVFAHDTPRRGEVPAVAKRLGSARREFADF